MSIYAFELCQRVELIMSRERGEVIGRAEYTDQPHQYLVRYVAADGRQVENWFIASAIDSLE